jgi:glutaredoxin
MAEIGDCIAIEPKKVKGKNCGKIIIYALSTCGWCKRTKELLSNLGVEYGYVDVDLLSDEDRKKAADEILKWNPRGSYPTIVINDKECVVGFDEAKLKKTAGMK